MIVCDGYYVVQSYKKTNSDDFELTRKAEENHERSIKLSKNTNSSVEDSAKLTTPQVTNC